MAKRIVITNKHDNLINNIVDTQQKVEGGLLVNDGVQEYIIGYIEECNVYQDVEIPQGVLPAKYFYSPVEEFTLNTSWEENLPIEVKLKKSNERLALCEQALLEMMGV